MKFISTRAQKQGIKQCLTVSEAMQTGLAEDGGLFVPELFPQIDWKNIDKTVSYPDFAKIALAPYFKGDVLEKVLSQICDECFTFDLPLVKLNKTTSVLELFHGPTLSFKDFGARFLACCLSHLKRDKTMTIIVATSRDTGSAVAAAFHQKSNIRVVVMFPEGKISARQQSQITCWGDNVLAVSVDGTFDDCQALVKSAFTDSWWQNETQLNTSNSINIGRLLPQSTYYAYTSWKYYLEHGKVANFVVPSGNIGNVTAAFWARQCGFPIGDIVVSQNANSTLVSYLKTGKAPDQNTIETLANAMDVGKPSNFERLQALFPDFEVFKSQVRAFEASDADISAEILKLYRESGYLACPHTATTFFAKDQLNMSESAEKKHWVLISTADPCKFETVLEPIIQEKISPTPALQALLDKSGKFVKIKANMTSLYGEYERYFSDSKIHIKL